MIWTTSGNVLGAFVFGLLIHYSELISGEAKGGPPGGGPGSGRRG